MLFVMELTIGDMVFYTTSTGLQVPANVVCLFHNGHVELECDQGGVWAVNHRYPMDSHLLWYPQSRVSTTISINSRN